jgi:hypothetical protein
MSRRGTFILGGGLLTGLLLISLFKSGIASRAPKAASPPELGGQKVPANRYEIQFNQKYDLFCSSYDKEPMIYRNCKIVGFTGGDESTESRRISGSSGFALSPVFSSASEYAEYFNRWLVLELADGRLAYVPPAAVRYIEQASSPAK